MLVCQLSIIHWFFALKCSNNNTKNLRIFFLQTCIFEHYDTQLLVQSMFKQHFVQDVWCKNYVREKNNYLNFRIRDRVSRIFFLINDLRHIPVAVRRHLDVHDIYERWAGRMLSETGKGPAWLSSQLWSVKERGKTKAMNATQIPMFSLDFKHRTYSLKIGPLNWFKSNSNLQKNLSGTGSASHIGLNINIRARFLLNVFQVVHWTSKFWILYIYRVHLIIMWAWNYELQVCTYCHFFSSLKSWCPVGRHFAGRKIKASWSAKSHLWSQDAVKWEPGIR